MLDLSQIDLSALADALEDHSDDTSWWLDPETGELESRSEYLSSEEDEEHPGDRGFVAVEPLPSSVGYRDMEDFIARVRDPRARDLLERAIGGRGAFRRFKDTLFELPKLRTAWFAFHDARVGRRALEWLAQEGLVDREAAERGILARPDPEPAGLGHPFDADAIARAVADDLRELYGERLHGVLLFGSWARGDAHPESDIDLLVVLDRVDSTFAELRRMEEILWRHSFSNDTVVSATPVSQEDLDARRRPVLIRAIEEGRDVA